MIMLPVSSSYNLDSISNRRYLCETYQDLFDYEEYSVCICSQMYVYIYIYGNSIFCY